VSAPGVRTEAVVDAPPERVWEVLADLPGWNVWNPTLFDVRRPAAATDDRWAPAPGMEVRMNLRLWRLKVPMRQQIRVVDAPRELVWRSKQMLPAAAFDVIRTFRLEPAEGGGTRLLQFEEGSGFLAKAIFALIGKGVRDGYDNMARALAGRL
jgi:hypothetical protein